MVSETQISLTVPISVVMKDDGVRGILVQCTLADGTRMKDFWLKGNLAFDGEDKFHSVIVSTCVNQIADAVQNAD